MLLIGFGHRARQGKDTAASAILNACDLEAQVRIYAFADALRSEVRVACAAMGGQHELIQQWKQAGMLPDWVTFEEPKPRSLLQWWGTDYKRKADDLYWVKRLRKTLDEHKPEVALITDVRFPNETEAIHEWGGVLVKCERLGAPDVVVHEHPSEAALDGYTGWNHYIRASSVEDCREQAVALHRRLNAERIRSVVPGLGDIQRA